MTEYEQIISLLAFFKVPNHRSKHHNDGELIIESFSQVRVVLSLVSLCIHVALLFCASKGLQLHTNQLVVWFVEVRVNN
jgi:hypothetical protein